MIYEYVEDRLVFYFVNGADLYRTDSILYHFPWLMNPFIFMRGFDPFPSVSLVFPAILIPFPAKLLPVVTEPKVILGIPITTGKPQVADQPPGHRHTSRWRARKRGWQQMYWWTARVSHVPMVIKNEPKRELKRFRGDHVSRAKIAMHRVMFLAFEYFLVLFLGLHCCSFVFVGFLCFPLLLFPCFAFVFFVFPLLWRL